jgi:hypothetical protein
VRESSKGQHPTVVGRQEFVPLLEHGRSDPCTPTWILSWIVYCIAPQRRYATTRDRINTACSTHISRHRCCPSPRPSRPTPPMPHVYRWRSQLRHRWGSGARYKKSPVWGRGLFSPGGSKDVRPEAECARRIFKKLTSLRLESSTLTMVAKSAAIAVIAGAAGVRPFPSFE